MSVCMEKLLDVEGVKTPCLVDGSGPPLVLLHGLGASNYSWRRVWQPLAAKRTVVRFDWPGHGHADKPSDFDYSVKGYSRFLVGALDALGFESADVAGNSLGGIVALYTTLHHPARIKRLALLGTPTYLGDHPKFLWPLRWPLVGRLFEWSLGPWAVSSCMKNVFVDQSVVTPEMVETYSHALRGADGRRAVASFVRNAIPPDADAIMARYPSLSHPTLVVWGDRDCMVAASSAHRFAKEVSTARFVKLEACGHAPQEERPADVLKAFEEFFV